MRDIGHQGEWSLRQRLNKGTCDTEAEIGKGHPEVLFEKASDSRFVLRERHERTQLSGDRRRPQQLAEQASAHCNNVRPDCDRLPPYRLDVAWVLRALVGEAFLIDLVCLFHTLDDIDQVLGRRALGIESHDDAAGDGIHLRPLHSREGVQCPLHVAHQCFALRVVDSAYLDMSLALADPRPAAASSRAQTVESAA